VWEHSDIAWASRWDLYLYMGDDQVHWFSILNSLVIVLLLSGIVAMIMVRTLRRDLAEYNSAEEKEELLEESGWKLVHADVLRTPPQSTLLATSLGTGMQLLCMAFISIACAMLGFLSPANRGSMLTVTLLLFVLMGCVAGYR
jgi:transmembrane 9 superfamily protein 2/4